ALMCMIITGVGTLIHVYAFSYMEKEPSYWRFFCYLNLFIFAMLLLVLGDNFIVMFFGWEGVGLCSYLLIGFWYKDYKKAKAGMKAFVVNRVGDWGFICGVALLFWGLGGAWLQQSGDFLPDYRARFAAVQIERPGHADHAKGGDHAKGDDGHAKGDKNERKKETAAGLKAKQRKSGTLTMTSHAGARVYLGVTSTTQLRGKAWKDCATLPQWNAKKGQQVGGNCYASSPFIRKRLPAGVHALAIVPGDGGVVQGDGTEIASMRLRVKAGEGTHIAAIGPTLTFREIHDQLVIKDVKGTQFLRNALESKTVWGGIGLITFACLCFFVGAAGKSAQLPLYVWLPDAMAGPTPVSALIHVATMVTAGVYMIVRLNFLFSLTPSASGIIALVGALTAAFAATIGFFQYDIKKVLAYSTVSQLGFMFIGVGVGAYWAAIFHLMTHAFFKACLFLASGSVIHGMHEIIHDEEGVQDMRNMGGLRSVMPITARTYFISCLAITAAPIPFFAGFWSKDEILWKAFNSMHTGFIPGIAIYVIGLAAALGTSFYMWRSYYLTFEGKHAHRKIARKVKESPLAMTGVLVVLAFLATVTGALFGFSTHFIGGHGEPILEQWLHPVLAHSATHIPHGDLLTEYLLMAISVLGALAMWGLALTKYGSGRPRDWAAREQRLPGFSLLYNKYWVDEIYDRTIIAAFMKTRLVLNGTDRWIVDGLVNGIGVLTRLASWVTGAIDQYIVDGLVNGVANGTAAMGGKLRSLQTGQIQNYVYGICGGIACLAVIQYFL
ncbi:hypothetical protein JYT22_01130, partial [Endomicrobium sp. AH-315-J14]|nr:hypothetical protein [Endomicrobium sp. AH-315-J14]